MHLLISSEQQFIQKSLGFEGDSRPNLVSGDNRIVEDEEEEDDKIWSVHYYILKVKGLQGALEGKGIDA